MLGESVVISTKKKNGFKMSENEESATKKVNKYISLNFLLSTVTLLAPAAYLIGSFFYQGQLAGFGVETNVFAISTTEIYLYFYNAATYLFTDITNSIIIKFLQYVSTPTGAAVLASIIFAVIVFLYVLLKLKKSEKNIIPNKIWRVLSRLVSYLHWKDNDFTKAMGISSLSSYILFLMGYLVLGFTFFWLFIPYGAYQKGYSLSKDKIEKYHEHGCYIKEGKDWSNCVEVIEGNKRISRGLLFAGNDKFLGIFNENESNVFINKSEYVVCRVRRKPTDPQNTNK